MIKLFAAKGACSLAPHIVIHELGLPYELKLIQLGTAVGREELKKVNPMEQVPTLVTEEGYPLAEGQAIMQYLVSQKPNSLFPASGKERFSDDDYALGKTFTVVDAYLFVVLNWRKAFKIDFNPYKKLNAFMERVGKRPSVLAAMKAEGLAS